MQITHGDLFADNIEISNTTICGLDYVSSIRKSFDSTSDSVSGNLGPRDLKLLSAAVFRGDSHAKVMRFVNVYFNLRVARRVWVDIDTYKIGRECTIEMMSESTMHTIHKGNLGNYHFDSYTTNEHIALVNDYIDAYTRAKRADMEKEDLDFYFLQIKSNLGEGFMQERTLMMNYQTLRHIYFDRLHHRQPEFRVICGWIEGLPYSQELITLQ